MRHVVQGAQVVALGDFVELAALPGETDSTVAQVRAMWAECPVDGNRRMLARCCRFYRPQVCADSGLRVRFGGSEGTLCMHSEVTAPCLFIASHSWRSCKLGGVMIVQVESKLRPCGIVSAQLTDCLFNVHTSPGAM